ncbi:MAG TPA: PQQ-dependent sugar dehydrogenase [Terriglobia bacterium]|nr:PQQ-dependent sugar dehydrogenase [Terriglobia bacterium]
MKMRFAIASVVLLLTISGIGGAGAQQPGGRGGAGAQQPGARGGTPAPITWPSPPLPAGPIVVDTAIQRQVRLFITKGFNQPWSMAFLPDGAILVTERPGRLRIVRNGALDPAPVSGTPAVRAQGLGGLMDLALHPRFNENRLIYFTYHKPVNNAGVITLARGRWDGSALAGVEDVFSALASGNASRIAFGKDGMVYMTIGVGDPPAADQAQDPNSLSGKVLRLRDDGTVPADNPFVGRAGYRPEIFTLGHRNILGLTVHPETGAIWECENGPNGGDEINVLLAGKNYGWPLVSFGRFYAGPLVSEKPWQEGMEQPLVFWTPAIAVSGLTFYTGDKFPGWKNNVFVGGMRTGEVPRSGHLERIDFNERWEELHREGMLRELQNRIRDVRQGPDGFIYLLTAENDGALMRMEPYTPN